MSRKKQNTSAPQNALSLCPFCKRTDGVYIDRSEKVYPALRYRIECVCGASGAPFETEDAAVNWWNTRA